jgi:hypothetical protein
MVDARPRSASEIIDSSFNILREHYGDFVTAAAVMYLPMLAVALLFPFDPRGGSVSSATTVLTRLIFPIFWVSLTNAAISVLTSQIFRGETPDIRAALEHTLRRALPLSVVVVLLWAATGIAFIFLFIPALLVLARWGLAITVAALEPTGVTETFARASRLSEGNRVHYLGTLALVFVLYIIAAVTVTFIAGLGTALLHTTAVAIVSGALLSIFLQPVIGVAQALLYFDMRIRNEGYDLQLMSEQLAADPAPAAALTP